VLGSALPLWSVPNATVREILRRLCYFWPRCLLYVSLLRAVRASPLAFRDKIERRDEAPQVVHFGAVGAAQKFPTILAHGAIRLRGVAQVTPPPPLNPVKALVGKVLIGRRGLVLR